MLSCTFSIFGILLFALCQIFTAIHWWKWTFNCINPFLVAESPHIFLESEFCIVYDNYRNKDAEKGQLTQGHFLRWSHLKLMQTSVEGRKCHQNKHDDKDGWSTCKCSFVEWRIWHCRFLWKTYGICSEASIRIPETRKLADTLTFR
jgi:hypothetical protein